jgi:hypothetical protein
MSTAAGGSGDGGRGDRGSSHGKSKITNAPPDKPKKMSSWERVMLRFFARKTHRCCC